MEVDCIYACVCSYLYLWSGVVWLSIFVYIFVNSAYMSPQTEMFLLLKLWGRKWNYCSQAENFPFWSNTHKILESRGKARKSKGHRDTFLIFPVFCLFVVVILMWEKEWREEKVTPFPFVKLLPLINHRTLHHSEFKVLWVM